MCSVSSKRAPGVGRVAAACHAGRSGRSLWRPVAPHLTRVSFVLSSRTAGPAQRPPRLESGPGLRRCRTPSLQHRLHVRPIAQDRQCGRRPAALCNGQEQGAREGRGAPEALCAPSTAHDRRSTPIGARRSRRSITPRPLRPPRPRPSNPATLACPRLLRALLRPPPSPRQPRRLQAAPRRLPPLRPRRPQQPANPRRLPLLLQPRVRLAVQRPSRHPPQLLLWQHPSPRRPQQPPPSRPSRLRPQQPQLHPSRPRLLQQRPLLPSPSRPLQLPQRRRPSPPRRQPRLCPSRLRPRPPPPRERPSQLALLAARAAAAAAAATAGCCIRRCLWTCACWALAWWVLARWPTALVEAMAARPSPRRRQTSPLGLS